MKKKLQFLCSVVALMLVSLVAKAQNPGDDVTATYITNWDFTGCSNGNFPGWVISAPDGGNTWVHGSTAVEYWNNNLPANFDYYQVVKLPAGKYKLSASMWNTQGTVTGESGVYGTSGGVTVFAGVTDDCDDKNLHTYTTEEITVIDGTLRVGVKNNDVRKANWFGVDWIKLIYVDNISSEDLITSYNQAFAAAQETAAKTDKASSETKNALNIAIESYANIDKTSTDELIAAINALSTAKDNMEASIVAYAPLTAIINEGETIKANADATAADVYTAAIADVQSAYDAGIVEDIPTAIGVVEKALPALAKAQTVPGSDMTRAIVNATINGNANGWTTEKTVAGNGPLFGTSAFEYWSYTEGKGGFDYYQEISGLPNGFYTISAEMFNDQVAPASNTFAPAAGVYGTAGQETVFALVTTQGADPIRYTTEKIAVTDGKLRIGVKNSNEDGDMPARWFYADNFQLTYVEKFINYDGFDYAAAGENLFANGSFDDGVTGWKTIGYTTDAVASNFTITATGGFDDGAYITTNGAGVGSEKTIRQSVAVEAGKTYYFTVYTSGKAPDANNFNYNALFKMSDATTEDGVLKAFEWPQGAAQTSSTWSQTEFVFTADESHPFVGVRMGWNQNSNFDGFALFEVKPVAVPIATLIERAQNLLDDPAYALITGEERTALSTAIVENANPGSSSEEYQAAADAITNASDAFKAALSSYESLATVKAIVDLEAWPYASAEKKTAVEALLVDPSNATDATEKAAALTTAYRQFVESNALAEGVEGAVDMTSLIVNPTAEEAIADPWKVVLGEGSGGALDVKNGEPWTDGSGNLTHKYFDGGDWGKTAWDVSLTQDITLKPGKYMLTAIARASGDVAFSLFAGETKATIPSIGAAGGVFNRGWNDQFVEFEVTEAGTVTIGVQGVTSKQYNWMSMSNFRLVQLEATGGEEPVIADLTQAMFFDWDGVDAEAQKTSDTPTGCDYKLNTSTDMVYGTSTVTHTKYADLSEWDYLTIAAPQGTPRLQFNRKTADGQDHVKIPDNAEDVEKYIKKSEDGTFVYNLAAIKAVWGFVHLNAIKTSSGPGIIQEMKLSTVKPYEPTWYTISVAEGFENGTVEATLTKSVAGAPVSVTATPAEGFELKAIKYTAEGEEPTTQEGTTFTMPAANVTVSATFTKAPEYIVSDLTKAMFHDWSAADGTAEIITEEAACDYAIGDVEAKAEGVALYGNGSVLGQSFADLSEYKSLALDVESGAIRIMLNTVGQENPKTYIELNQGSSKSYFSINNKTWTIDLDKFKQVENVEYVHLNVIKVAWGSSAAISAAKLTKLAEETPTLYTITIAETENGTVATDVEEAAEGATVTVTVTPNDGFMVDEVSLTYGEGQKVEFDGEPTENEGVLSATFTMPAGNVNVGFTFKKVEYDITVAGATPSEEPGAYLVEGGKICISSDAAEDEVVTLSLGPDEGYEVESVSVKKNSDNSEVTLIPDPEHQTNLTFIMPGEAVTVTAAFKKTSVEPTPTIAATLVHTAASFCGDPAGEFTSTVDAEAEHVNNSNFSNKWAGAAYADFSLATLPAGATITKATLTFTGIGEARNARNTNVQYVNQDLTLDYTALSAGNANVNLAATDITSVSFPKYTEETKSQEFTIDVTDFVKDIAAKQNYIIFKWTDNPGGGDVAGKASENAPTLIIEYIPGAPEIANASFELDGEKAASNSALELTGWTFGGVGTQFNNTELRPAESESTTSQFGTSAPSDGEYSLFFRQGWNGGGNTITLTSDALAEIPAGDYVLSVDYKQHYSHDGSANENTKVGIALVNGENTIGSELSPAATGVQGGTADNTYFNDTDWSTLAASFTVDEAIPAGAQVVITLYSAGQRRSDFFLDNVQFTKVPGIELALIELKKAIDAAEAKKATYGVGDGLFQYPASEIEPLTTAIATAQDAYNAAESKAVVEAATQTLNDAVAGFAPQATTPDPEKQYMLTLKTSDPDSPFELSVSTEGIKIVAAEEGTPITFVAQEGGTYAIFNGSEYVNYQGSDNWTMAATADAYGWAIATVEGGYTITGKNGFLGTNTSNGNAVNSPCYGDKKANNGNYIWGIAEYAEPTEKTIEIAIERFVGQGYGIQDETMDFTAAATFLGVDAVTNGMLRVVKSDDTLDESYGTYDGWFNKEGYAETWGPNSFVNVKLWLANDGGQYTIQDMGGDQGAAVPAVGDKVTVKWAAVANEKTVFFNFNVTFVEIPVPELTISDVKVQKDVIYDNTVTSNYVEQIVELTDDEVQTILTELNLTSLDEAKVYGYNPSDESFVVAFAGFDGWRDANGDFAMHTGTTDVPACCKYTDGKSYPCYNIAGVGDKIVKTYWAIANDEKAVLVEVDFWFGDAYTSIDGIAAGGKTMKNGRKYMENGKIFIYRNGKKYSTTGVELK